MGSTQDLIAQARRGKQCFRCYGRGKRPAPCGFCEDSTHDHECPPDESCHVCDGSGWLHDPLTVALADALEALQTAAREHVESLTTCNICGAPATAKSLADLDHCDKHAGGLDRQMLGANRLRALLALLPKKGAA